MPSLDGEWDVKRVSGALPPLVGVRKRISRARGVTTIGPVPAARFDVRGLELHYRAPFLGLVDVLAPDGEAFAGRTSFRGRELGRFRMTRR